jgi:hypothetical protein
MRRVVKMMVKKSLIAKESIAGLENNSIKEGRRTPRIYTNLRDIR